MGMKIYVNHGLMKSLSALPPSTLTPAFVRVSTEQELDNG
jgi:hypothetical protein